jgi:hypothetical protein
MTGRVMARIESLEGKRTRVSAWGLFAEFAGATAALWLFVAALSLPASDASAWEEALIPGAHSILSGEQAALPEWMVNNHE